MLLTLLAMLLCAPADSLSWGRLNGNVQTASILYLNDGVTGQPAHVIGSNNYLKLDWQRDSLSAGLQAEWYPQALAGYPTELKGAGLTGLYIDWRHGPWQLHAGSFHEQLGSGLLLRSWEDREMGINNAITGGFARFSTRHAEFKLLGGMPKYGLWPTAGSFLAGADAAVEFFGSIRLEGSVTDRITTDTEADILTLAGLGGFQVPRHVPGWSARLQYAAGGFGIKAEYVGNGEDFYVERLPKSHETYRLNAGNAELLEINYAAGPFSAALTLRRLENMSSRIFLTSGAYSVANTLNYLPSLCMQQTYMLAGLNPYVTYADGEAGLMGDVYYNFRRGTTLGGRYGMKLHVGGSWIQALPCALPDRDKWYLAYRDINIELERRWSRELKTILFVSIQENSPTHGNRKATDAQNVFVLDGQWRASRTTALRLELQYLYSQELTRDWMAALLELTFAPHWSFSVSDMYNHGSTGVHYYNAAVSYSHKMLNISLSGGRTREGMVCSGGVCRWQPAYTGVCLRAQWSF